MPVMHTPQNKKNMKMGKKKRWEIVVARGK
jgi:hypothetical protein